MAVGRTWMAVAFGAVMALTLTGCGILGQAAPHHPPKPGYDQRWSAPPPMTIRPDATYTATVTTSLGTFVIRLFSRGDPVSVNNFVFLARHRFYNGDRIFRIIKPFVFQTGSPYQNGIGGPGYTFRGRIPPPYPYGPGIVAYANRGPGTNGSQFFVCTGPESESLNSDPIYPEIGRVIRGMAVVERIAAVPVTLNRTTGEDSWPVHPVVVRSITVHGPR